MDDLPPVWGVAVDAGRGALPYALVHGESLLACAVFALEAADVQPIDERTPWSVLREAGAALVLHDSLAPLLDPRTLRDCVVRAVVGEVVVAGVRPVVDTLVRVDDGLLGGGVDRDAVAALASPVVLPPGVLAALDDLDGAPLPPTVGGLHDLTALVGALQRAGRVVLHEVPASGRRIASLDELSVLEAQTDPR